MSGGARREREPTLSARLGALADYLSIEVDAFDFAWLLPEFFASAGSRTPGSYDPDDPSSFLLSEEGAAATPAFEAWLTRHRLLRPDIASDPHSPAYLTFDNVSRPTPDARWLVHFSDDAEEIARSGFIYGQPDESLLALTTHFTDEVRRKRSGWNFAFEHDSPEAFSASRARKYGRDAVLFRARYVLATHYGDMERQAIFWGPSVSRVALVERDGWRWVARDTGGRGEACSGDFTRALECCVSLERSRGLRVFRKVKE